MSYNSFRHKTSLVNSRWLSPERGEQAKLVVNYIFFKSCPNAYPNNFIVVNRGTVLHCIIKRTPAKYELCRVPGSWDDHGKQNPLKFAHTHTQIPGIIREIHAEKLPLQSVRQTCRSSCQASRLMGLLGWCVDVSLLPRVEISMDPCLWDQPLSTHRRTHTHARTHTHTCKLIPHNHTQTPTLKPLNLHTSPLLLMQNGHYRSEAF